MDNNDVVLIVVVAVAIGAWMLFRRLGFVSAATAKALMARGARVIDVRTRAEFSSGHIGDAINVPLDELGQRIGSVAKDKSTPLLLHCLSGGRSAMARHTLKQLGYTEVHNLGSLGCARHLVERAR